MTLCLLVWPMQTCLSLSFVVTVTLTAACTT